MVNIFQLKDWILQARPNMQEYFNWIFQKVVGLPMSLSAFWLHKLLILAVYWPASHLHLTNRIVYLLSHAVEVEV
jgi:hypothetical protein